jgi:hypothetical protein
MKRAATAAAMSHEIVLFSTLNRRRKIRREKSAALESEAITFSWRWQQTGRIWSKFYAPDFRKRSLNFCHSSKEPSMAMPSFLLALHAMTLVPTLPNLPVVISLTPKSTGPGGIRSLATVGSRAVSPQSLAVVKDDWPMINWYLVGPLHHVAPEVHPTKLCNW